MPVRVIVFKREGRRFFEAQWSDPVTDRKKTKSTKTAERRDAERFAAKLEDKLNSEAASIPSKYEWEKFRERYETEVATDLAVKTRAKICTAFNAFERLIEPSNLSAITTETIALFRSKLTKQVKKVSQVTVRGYLAHLRAAFRWAVEAKLITESPLFKMPKQVDKAGGRAITGEEFDRMILAVKKIPLPPKDPASWEFLLKGLYWSGLRIGEAMQLHWIDDKNLCVDFSGKRPTFRIQAHAEKGKVYRVLPMAPEFAKLLQSVPKSNRRGFVFNPSVPTDASRRAEMTVVVRTIRRVGKQAGIKVGVKSNGKDKFASAHDLRRSFGDRWSLRVFPAILMEMMRHRSIQTTMSYYVGRNAQTTAETIWNAMPEFGAGVANTSANTSPKTNRRNTGNSR